MQIKKVFRQERKFLISGEQYYRFSRQFAELFKEDSHNGKDGYMVRSLYFDTLGNKDFEEKLAGVECRRKMRLRIYSPQSRTALLEMKQKQGSNQLKRSLTISREHAEELMKGHYEVLLEYSDPFATECYGVLKTNCYIPKVIVEYKRMAFVFKENDTRITFLKSHWKYLQFHRNDIPGQVHGSALPVPVYSGISLQDEASVHTLQGSCCIS